MTKQQIILRPKSRTTEYFFHNQEEIYTQIWEQTISLEKETTENKNLPWTGKNLYSEVFPKSKEKRKKEKNQKKLKKKEINRYFLI